MTFFQHVLFVTVLLFETHLILNLHFLQTSQVAGSVALLDNLTHPLGWFLCHKMVFLPMGAPFITLSPPSELGTSQLVSILRSGIENSRCL